MALLAFLCQLTGLGLVGYGAYEVWSDGITNYADYFVYGFVFMLIGNWVTNTLRKEALQKLIDQLGDDNGRR